MLDHIGVDVTDIRRSRAFYEAALKPLGYRVIQELTAEQTGANPIVMFGIDAPEFVIAEDRAPGPGNHFAFRADTRGGRRLPCGGAEGRRAGQRAAGAATQLRAELLCRLRLRPGRFQY